VSKTPLPSISLCTPPPSLLCQNKALKRKKESKLPLYSLSHKKMNSWKELSWKYLVFHPRAPLLSPPFSLLSLPFFPFLPFTIGPHMHRNPGRINGPPPGPSPLPPPPPVSARLARWLAPKIPALFTLRASRT
jgi:hypothetical protein